MKVYLIKTPEVELQLFQEVYNFLSSFDSPFDFVGSQYEFDREEYYFLQWSLFPHHNFDYPDNETVVKFDVQKGYPLSWRELFSLCEGYRNMFSISPDSFVVLLTDRKNALNWFSSFDKNRNIFVQTSEWESFTVAHPKYAIAYQILENIMGSLMNLDISIIPNQYIHEPVIGCMNDFCHNKNRVVIKMQTANICSRCLNKLKDENINSTIINSSISIFQAIRNEVVYHISQPPVELQPIIITNERRIVLTNQNIELRLTPIRKALYIFFLMHNEGVPLVRLSDFDRELIETYRSIKKSVSAQDAQVRIEALTHPSGDGFNPTKSHINKYISDIIKPPLTPQYIISGSANNPYRIELPREMVDIQF